MHPLSFLAHSRLSRSRIFLKLTNEGISSIYTVAPVGLVWDGQTHTVACGASVGRYSLSQVEELRTCPPLTCLSSCLSSVSPPHPSADRSVTTVVWYDSVFGGRRLPLAGQPLRLDLHAPGGPGQDHHGEGAVGRANISFCVSMWSVQTNQWHSQGIVSLEQRQKKRLARLISQ